MRPSSGTYTLGDQLEQRGRTTGHGGLSSFGALRQYLKDVAARLRRLMDAERAKPKAGDHSERGPAVA